MSQNPDAVRKYLIHLTILRNNFSIEENPIRYVKSAMANQKTCLKIMSV